MKRTLIFVYQLFIWLPVFLVITILTALTVSVGCFCGGERFFSYYPAVWWSKLVCIITLCPVKVTGREKLSRKQSYVFVANHQSAFDIFLIFGYLGQPIKWIMKKSLRKIPFVGKACELAGFIFVDNSSPKAAAKTIEEAKAKLKNGTSVVLFPEGSRTQTGRMDRFKKGAYQMALDLKLPIVSITLNGPYEVMPIHSYLIYPQKMEMIIHDPIPTEHIVVENMRDAAVKINELVTETRNRIESDLWEQYKN